MTAGTDQRVRFWDVETGKERGGFASWVAEWLQRFVGAEPRPARGELRNRTQVVRDLAFSPGGRWLATTAGWGAMLWELPPGELSAAALTAARGK
ncbi:MAG TPA: hypothetical protein VIL46_17105, partial [Gemmataceae bacterium]